MEVFLCGFLNVAAPFSGFESNRMHFYSLNWAPRYGGMGPLDEDNRIVSSSMDGCPPAGRLPACPPAACQSTTQAAHRPPASLPTGRQALQVPRPGALAARCREEKTGSSNLKQSSSYNLNPTSGTCPSRTSSHDFFQAFRHSVAGTSL